MRKRIKGFEDYEITESGEVYSYKHKNPHKMRPGKDGDGYSIVQLYYGHKKSKPHKVHRLVAEAFIPNPNNFPEVDHWDGDKSNNDISNLRWVSHKENSNNPNTKTTGEQHWNYGKHPSEETRKKLSESRAGEGNGMYGKRHSEETKNRIREANKDFYKNRQRNEYGRFISKSNEGLE